MNAARQCPVMITLGIMHAMRRRRYAGFYNMERVMGIEPTFSAWEADVLPLNYTRMPHRYGMPPCCRLEQVYTGFATLSRAVVPCQVREKFWCSNHMSLTLSFNRTKSILLASRSFRASPSFSWSL